MGDLKKAFETLRDKAAHHEMRWNYYDGNHPLRWSTDRLKKVFGESTVPCFRENWCAVVVDSVIDRLVLEGLSVADNEDATSTLRRLLEATGLALDVDEVHREADVTGEAYVIAWKEDEEVEVYHNHAASTHLFYDEDHPRRKKFAAKSWVDADKHQRITLYYPDRLEYYRCTKKVGSTDASGTFKEGDWEPLMANWPENPYAEIPVFHFRLTKRGASELDNAIPLQDIVNKVVADMMVTGEFAAFPQRWAVTQSDLSGAKLAPHTMLQIPAGDGETETTQVGMFQAADLGNFTRVMDSMTQAMAVISRTPKHYFWAQGGDPSGEALVAMEAPLTKKVGRYLKRFSSTWQEVAAFLLRLSGAEVESSAITALWGDVRTVQPFTQAQIRKTNKEAGIPIKNQLRDEGWTETELKQLEDDIAAAADLEAPAGTTSGVGQVTNAQGLVDALIDAIEAAGGVAAGMGEEAL